MKCNLRYVVRYKPRKRSVKKRKQQFGGQFDPFKGSPLVYLTNKFKSFAKFGRRVLREATVNRWYIK